MITNLDYQECQKLYVSGLSVTQISKLKNLDRHNLSRKLKKDGYTIRSGFSYARQYQLQEHYFDIIDSEDKAYMLGFIYADGNNLFKYNRISIHLASKDAEILEKFSNILYGKNILKYSKDKKYVYLNCFSKHMSQQLANLGVVERKSDKIQFPDWLDIKLYRHFIRGLIDGDGWIRIPNCKKESPAVGLISTASINNFLSCYYQQHLQIKSYLCKAYKQDKSIINEIRVKNYHQCTILLKWLYQDANLYLARKYLLAQQILAA